MVENQFRLNKTDITHSIGIIIYAIMLGVLVALIAGFYEKAFHFLAYYWRENNYLLTNFPQWILLGSGPFLACPILYYILKKIPEYRQHSPTDLISGIHTKNGKINAKSSLLSVLASIFSIGFGFSVGYYSPTVQLGGGIGVLFHKLKWIRPVHRYISIGCGASAAIAAIFHSPLGAVIFVHEVLLRFFSIRAFAPITISAVTSYVVSSKFFDKAIFFNLPSHYLSDVSIYFIAALGGIIAAFIGISQIHNIMWLQRWNAKRKIGIFYQLLIAAILTSLIIILVPEVAGSSFNVMNNLITGHSYSLTLLFIIFMAKGAATIIAFGFGISGGIFGPTIFTGAALGGLITGVIQIIFPTLTFSPDIIIITTMAAMISAVIGAPISMILITIEITGDFQIVSVVMLAVVMANITAYRLMGTSSFFDLQLKSRGLDLEHGRDRLYTETHSISQLISEDYLTIDSTTDLNSAEQQMLEMHKNVAFVVDEHNYLIGRIKLVDIELYRITQSEETKVVADIVQKNIEFVYRASSIWQAMEAMPKTNVNFIPVLDGENNPKLIGVVYNNDLMSHYLTFLSQLRNEENVV
ncbi:chloride channel protein [Pasteurella skyensis]|uniref:Chloride channel protein n=1 Tax=Phocoenobacter skyensis TaxID=97481 RepID=A0AAJ6P371_9PAST|nr:chloride channel protein [Pasteurella skyensis]MDP8171197.1 chloride channel protein [Pasteurella skyensis]MDP8175484.1 chloride channel protein [Pasteurella skyensis]